MGHAAFRDMILLAKGGVPWDVAKSWSAARRAAALAIIQDRNESL